MIQKTILVILFFILGTSVKAQNVEFTVEGPRAAVTGSYFKVAFVVNETPSDFEGPDFGDLEVVAGPIRSETTSISYANNKSTSLKKTTFTYGLIAHKDDTITINPAKVEVDGKVHYTKPYSIEIAEDNTIIRLFGDKSSLYKGEPLVITAKLYDRTEIHKVKSSKMPDFNGFWKQELPIDQQLQVERDTFNGKAYDTRVIGKYLLFPQEAGELTIDRLEIPLVATKLPKENSLFDNFVLTVETEQTVSSQPFSVNVKDLPAGAPSGFEGAVGEFAIECNIDTEQINANSGGMLSLLITGRGNMPLINAPKITLPETFEGYPSKTTDKSEATVSGVKGHKKFDYPFIAHAKGEYEIAPITFVYFDPCSETYKEASTTSKKINVQSKKKQPIRKKRFPKKEEKETTET